MIIGRATRNISTLPLVFALEMWGRISEAMRDKPGGVAITIRRAP
jgi:hypothetical protein